MARGQIAAGGAHVPMAQVRSRLPTHHDAGSAQRLFGICRNGQLAEQYESMKLPQLKQEFKERAMSSARDSNVDAMRQQLCDADDSWVELANVYDDVAEERVVLSAQALLGTLHPQEQSLLQIYDKMDLKGEALFRDLSS